MIFGKFRKAKNSDTNLAEINENTELAVFSEVENDVKPKKKRSRENIRKNINGAISIFLVLIMIPMFTFAGTIVDLSRVNSANVVLSGASDLTMNAALSDYNEILKDVYGIFAMSATEADLTNNLERYFNNSLSNVSDLDTTDSYTRDYINSLTSWLSTAGSEGSADFDTLIKLTNATCDVSYVGGSEVYHSNILKRQILEYMKYRGVVSVSQELISKFSGFSGFDKQSKAIKAKMKYEKELKNIGDSCQAAYNQIKRVRDNEHKSVNEEILGHALEDNGLRDIEVFKETYMNTVALAKENYAKISRDLVCIKVLEEKEAEKISTSYDWNMYNAIMQKVEEATENMENELTPDEVYDDESSQVESRPRSVSDYAKKHRGVSAVLSGIDFFRDHFIGLRSSCTVNSDGTDFDLSASDTGGFYTKLENFKDKVVDVKDNVGSEIGQAQTIKIYDLKNDINDFVNDEENKEYIANIMALREYARICGHDADCRITAYFECIDDFIQDINDVADYANDYINNYKDEVKNLASKTNKQIGLIKKDCDIITGYYEAVEDSLDKVIGDIDKAEKEGNNWKEKIDNVTDNSSKQTMTSDYESEAQPIKKADVEALRDKVLKPNREFYEDILKKINTIEYCGKGLASNYGANPDNHDYEKEFKKSKIMPETVDNSGMSAAVNSAKDNFKSDAGFDFKIFCRLLEDDEFAEPSGATTKAYDNNQQFFEYLVINFKNTDQGESSEEDGDVEGAKEALIDEGKVSAAKENAKNDKTLSGDVSSDFLEAMVTNNSKSQKDLGVDPSDPEGSSDDNVTDAADSMSDDETTDFFDAISKVGELLTKGRDKLYLVEYMRNMFSCYTTNIDPDAGNQNIEEKKDKEVGSQYENKDDFEKTLSGIAISADNNYYYGGECEYILWGGNPKSAVNKTKASIFGIRFILNLIYSMSAPDINALTFEWATVIAGWTVFGVPIVQTVLKIALALAESAYDLNQLCLGKSVPLYKSSTTWAMSPQGMIGIAKDAAAELIENAAQEAGAYLNDSITNIFDKIENTANNKISEIGDDVKKYMNQTIRDVSDKVINATVTPFMNGIKGVLGKIDSSWGKDKIKEELQNCLDKLKEGATDDIYGQAKTVAIEYLEGKIGEVTDTIYDSLQEAAGVKSETIIGKINDLFKTVDSGVNSGTGYISELNDVISNKITELSGDLKKTVTDTLNSTEDNVKEKLNEALNNFSNELSEKVSGGLDKVGDAAPDNNTVGDVTNAKAATISLNYKEYLYAFMLIGIMANEDNMVARTGYLMQMNISQKMTDAGFDDSDRENFNMTKMYTMVQIHSEADVGSVFMGLFEKKTVNGEESYSLNFDGNGSSTDRLVYNGFIGY